MGGSSSRPIRGSTIWPSQCAAIELERADYRTRLEAGNVTEEERRDRTMAHDGYRYLDGDIRGLHCLHEREVRFGNLRYLMFRDIEEKIWMLEWGMDVLPLTQMRFDIYLQKRTLLDPTIATAAGSRRRTQTQKKGHPRGAGSARLYGCRSATAPSAAQFRVAREERLELPDPS